MRKYILDGDKFDHLDGFFVTFGEMINGPDGYFGKNMASFDDCLFGGFGMESPCIIIWKNSSRSKIALGYEASYKFYKNQIDDKKYLDSDGLKFLELQVEKAMEHRGATLFDQIVDQINSVEQRSFGKTKIELILD